MQAYPAATAASSFAAAVAPPASPGPARLGTVRVPTPSAEDQAAMDAMVDSIVQLLLAADGGVATAAWGGEPLAAPQ